MVRIVGLGKTAVSADGLDGGAGIVCPAQPEVREPGRQLQRFWKEEDGQDLVEYSLLLGFVALSGAAFYITMGATVTNIWGIVNNRLAAANQTS